MRNSRKLGYHTFVLAALSICTVASCADGLAVGTPQSSVANELTAQEKAAGWKLLFDGKTTRGWHNYQRTDVDGRWQAQDGALVLTALGGGDVLSDEQFDNFEFTYEWKISPGGNSGVFFHVVEGADESIWQTGPELQVLDDELADDRVNPLHRAGAAYDLYPPAVSATKPVGSYNVARLIVDHGHIEHWLNGQKVVEYDMRSEDWKRRLAASKFAAYPQFARAGAGHIALQDHGNPVWYRNLKIRPLHDKAQHR